jgi:hypothetical protein
VSPEVVLERRVELDVAFVVAEQVQLNLVGAGAGQIEVVERIAIWRNRGHVRYTVRVLPAPRLGSEEAAKRLSVERRWLLPIGPNGVPAVTQPFLIGVAVLGDDCGEAIRMTNCEAEADGCAIVEDVGREAMEADHLGEAIDDVRDILERVGEGAPRRHVRLPKPWQVGSDKAKPVRELRDEIAEHVDGGGKAVQQQDRWRVLRPGFAIEYSSTCVQMSLAVGRDGLSETRRATVKDRFRLRNRIRSNSQIHHDVANRL